MQRKRYQALSEWLSSLTTRIFGSVFTAFQLFVRNLTEACASEVLIKWLNILEVS